MTDNQQVREWLATSPGFFDANSVQACFIAAHNASGLDIHLHLFRGELEALGLSIRCLSGGSANRPASFRLSLSEVAP